MGEHVTKWDGQKRHLCCKMCYSSCLQHSLMMCYLHFHMTDLIQMQWNHYHDHTGPTCVFLSRNQTTLLTTTTTTTPTHWSFPRPSFEILGMSCSHDWLPPKHCQRTDTSIIKRIYIHKDRNHGYIRMHGVGEKKHLCCRMCYSSCLRHSFMMCYFHLIDITNFIKVLRPHWTNVVFFSEQATLLTTNATVI